MVDGFGWSRRSTWGWWSRWSMVNGVEYGWGGVHGVGGVCGKFEVGGVCGVR